jgi:hypothetical protein
MGDPRVNPYSSAIIRPLENGYYSMLELLMTDTRVNPAAQDNKALKVALNMDTRL